MTGTLQITGGEISPSVLVGDISYFMDGKITAVVLGISAHPKIKVKRAYACLTEVADAAATTYTVQLFNAGVAVSNVLTFTQGTEVLGDVKAFTIDANYEVILNGSALTAITAGTTTTLGEVIVVVNWENVN